MLKLSWKTKIFAFIFSRNFQADYFNWMNNVYIPYLYDANNAWKMRDAPRTTQYRVAITSCPFKNYKSVLCKANMKTEMPLVSDSEGFGTTFPKTRDLSLPHPLRNDAKLEAKAMIDDMRDNLWLIPQARSIKNVFKKTNPDMQLSAYYDLSIYMRRSGYAHTQLKINVVPSKDETTNLEGFGYFCMALLTVVLLVLGYRALIKMISNWRWIFDIWYLNRLFFILVTLAGLALHVYELVTFENKENVRLDYVIKNELAKHFFGVSMFLLLIRVSY